MGNISKVIAKQVLISSVSHCEHSISFHDDLGFLLPAEKASESLN